jgi:hypothetical protein
VPRRKDPTTLATRTPEQAVQETVRSRDVEKVWEDMGNPLRYLMRASKKAFALGEYATAISGFSAAGGWYAAKLRALEVEADQKPVAVSINIDLTRKDER